MLLQNEPAHSAPRPARAERQDRFEGAERRERAAPREPADAVRRKSAGADREGPREEGMERYRIEVGLEHQVKPANIVGAIANEAGLDSRHIGRITILEDHSLVDLPEGMPKEIFRHLKKTFIMGRPLKITRADGDDKPAEARRPLKSGKTSPAKGAAKGFGKAGMKGPEKAPMKKTAGLKHKDRE